MKINSFTGADSIIVIGGIIMKKAMPLFILLIVGSLIFITMQDINKPSIKDNDQQDNNQQEITQGTQQFLPVIESTWTPSPEIDPDAQYTQYQDNSVFVKNEEQVHKKSGLSSVIGNLFKNTPKSVVTNAYKAMINNDIDLFLKCNSAQDIESYAKKKGLTVDQVIEETKLHFAKTVEKMQYSGIELSDFEITQPDDHKSRDHAYVKVQYIGEGKDVENFLEVPVHRAYDKSWYIDIK
ncbi:MAG: hypothetical protein ACI8WT_003601 [Clostridium sp.]|jgi:hypothetical protein